MIARAPAACAERPAPRSLLRRSVARWRWVTSATVRSIRRRARAEGFRHTRRQYREGPATAIEPLGVSAHVTLQPGERIVSFTAGGGGYGPPLEREPARVRDDVIEGWISPTRARDVYGVVLNPAGEIDAAATLTRRAQMRRSG